MCFKKLKLKYTNYLRKVSCLTYLNVCDVLSSTHLLYVRLITSFFSASCIIRMCLKRIPNNSIKYALLFFIITIISYNILPYIASYEFLINQNSVRSHIQKGCLQSPSLYFELSQNSFLLGNRKKSYETRSSV